MAWLAYCWLMIIEAIVIRPDGFLESFYLSFYIHPIVLLFCQCFLWLKLLKRWILVVVLCPLRIVCFWALSVSRFCRVCVIYIFSFTTRVTNVEVTEEAENSEVFYDFDNSEILQICNQYQIVNSYSRSNMAPIICQLKVFEIQKDGFEEDNNYVDDTTLHEDEKMEQPSFFLVNDMSKNDYFSSTCSSNSSMEEEVSICSSNSPASDEHMNEHASSVCGFNIPVEEREVSNRREEEVDAYYKKYTARMGWFDLLNYDRTCGISAILNKQLGSPSSFESIETADFSIPYVSRSKVAKKRLMRSLESDLELVYVAQSCLSWEALQHQYRRVKTLVSFQNGVFYDNVAGEFQKFQVLLERFMEDERCEGKRTWNYVGGRFALKSLLQVPEISGFLEEEKEERKGEATSVKEVLRAIERCIQTFWDYVKTDTKKSWWKIRSSLWTYPPVENPRDLELLADLTRRLRKKELCLKDLQGKERCWFRRVVNPLEESQKGEMLFTMIDIKLVSRVLQMSTLSSSHLKWCQEKLDNIEFKEGKVFRTCTGPLLFPSS